MQQLFSPGLGDIVHCSLSNAILEVVIDTTVGELLLPLIAICNEGIVCKASIVCDSVRWWHRCWLRIARMPIFPRGFCYSTHLSSCVCIKDLKNGQQRWWLSCSTDWWACLWIALQNLVKPRSSGWWKQLALPWLPWTLACLSYCLLFAMARWSFHQRGKQYIMAVLFLPASLVSCHYLPILLTD